MMSLLSVRDYYYKSFNNLSYDERKKLNFDHPNAFDTGLLIEQLKKLKGMQPIQRPIYSFIEHRRLEETVLEEAKRVVYS